MLIHTVMEVVFSTREQKALKFKRNQIVKVILMLIVPLMTGMANSGNQVTLTDTLGISLFNPGLVNI